MRKLIGIALTLVLCLAVAGAQTSAPAAPAATDETEQLRQEVEQLKQQLNALEQRLAAQEKKAEQPAPAAAAAAPAASSSKDSKLEAKVQQLDRRVMETEKDLKLSKLRFSGDYRYEAHAYTGSVPDHYDGMVLQNLVVGSLFYAQTNGGAFPPDVASIRNNVQANYAEYLYFTNNLKFSDLKAAMGSFSPAQQMALMGMLMPAAYTKGYSTNNSILQTNRLRINMSAKLADNLSFSGRLSMYKVFGDSTGVQVFNGQPNSFSIDGTTARVPTGDMLRVERAFFTWSNIGGSKLYLSIGRRPSTDGPPLNLREDEPRGGTPLGSLIDYQFDGITMGYRVSDVTELRVCYGQGFESGWGNGDILKTPQDRLSDVHFFGGNFDLYNSDKMLVQATVARAFDVTDGFSGLVVLPGNPLTGDAIAAPVTLRYTPSANLGNINLAGVLFQRRDGPVDYFASFQWDGLRPYAGVTTPFGGLGSDPFDNPTNHDGTMVYAGLRYNMGPSDRTKLGFEFNHGSKYWFNFAQAADDILMPKTSTRGEVYETYLTHRINRYFIAKAGYQYFNFRWSGSGWHVGAPKRMDSVPLLGFPTYDHLSLFTFGMTARF
jgi:hypothetical protein